MQKKMNLWLSRAKEAISFESYDTYVIMTRKRDKKNGNKQVLGMSGIQTACATPESNHDVGGIIFTPGGVQGTRTAGHELGHIFGAEHDKPNCGKSYLIATFDGNPTDWSQCSINSFHESLKQQNWTCLYNKPNHTKFNNPGVYEIFESFEVEIENKDFFTVLMDDQKETFNLNEFTHSKEIVVYYIDGMLIIEQGGSDLAGEVIEPKELQYRIPDYRKLILNPKEIDPWKEINIYHEDNSIYAYQGSKPINITQNKAPPILDVSYMDDYQLKLIDHDFDPEKLVLIYYRDNKLHVTQKNEYLFEKKYWKDLNYVGSDRTIIFLCPMTTITKYGLTIKYRDDLIYIYQFEEPDSNGREYEPYTVRYSPDFKVLESDVKKSVDFEDSFETKITRRINTSDLNSKKLVLIGFKNGRVIVKQISTSFEEDQNVSSDYKNLQIITADRNTILVQSSKIPKRNEIQIRHDNGKIFVWQGSDQIPELNIDRPDIVKILKSDYFDYMDYFN